MATTKMQKNLDASSGVPERRCPICKQEHPASMTNALRLLSEHVSALDRRLKSISGKDFDRTYGKGKWSIRQVLCHLRDCEINFAMRWRKMVAEPGSPIVPFEQDTWCDKTLYKRQDPVAAHSVWKGLREANLELLRLAGKSAWGRQGIHPIYGRISVQQLALHVVAHDDNHFAQIDVASARR